MGLTVAILGRPNVGKSTLFNRLVGRRAAIVDPTPGVTRDWRTGDAGLGPLRFTVIDTGGLEEGSRDSLAGRVQAQTQRALAQADVALLMVDARAGVTPTDRHFARALRRTRVPIVPVANKCEGGAGWAGVTEAYELGLGEPVAISAEHGQGLDALYAALEPFAAAETDAPEERGDRPLRLAVVGRPNVGKSTLMNRLLGEERVVTGPEPGLTRDSIAARSSFRGRPVLLVDTAGLRRRARVTGRLQKLSVSDALRSIRSAEIVALVVDAEAALAKQDLTIAALAAEEGRALVVAVNKWDLVSARAATLKAIKERAAAALPQVRGVPVIPLSALTGFGVERLLPAVVKVYERWTTRVSTANLNRWLAKVGEDHPPPMAGRRRVKLRYITEVKARPPTFALFVSKPAELPEAYQRYLVNRLRDAFGFEGAPIRLLLRAGRNPYAGRTW
ncbi:MAG: ribosome biogenesis GTPase Der [Alphaproteobacteria bacterium]